MAHRERLYSGSGDGSIKVWDMADLRKGCLKTVAAHRDCVSLGLCVCVCVGRGGWCEPGTVCVCVLGGG